MQSRLLRLAEIQESRQVDAFLLTHLPTLRHLSGYFFNFESGPSPFHLLPGALIAVPGLAATLVVADSEGSQLSNVSPAISVRQYASYVYQRPLEFTKNFLAQIYDVFDQGGLGKCRVGVEPNSLPLNISQSLHLRYPGIEFVDVSQEITGLRLIKDPDEITLIRQAVRLCDVGQEAVQRFAQAGMTELELFTLVRGAMETAAGKRIPLMADLISGARTQEAGGSPCARQMESGDMIISDLTPCLDGYWGDTCNTTVVGKPSSTQRATFQLVKEALEIGITAVRPGVRAQAIDELMRVHLASKGGYPHHGGHGIGVTYHEEPRIVPYSDIELAPDMVIALEPGIYAGGEGLRLEHVLVVTSNGCELLSQFRHSLGQC